LQRNARSDSCEQSGSTMRRELCTSSGYQLRRGRSARNGLNLHFKSFLLVKAQTPRNGREEALCQLDRLDTLYEDYFPQWTRLTVNRTRKQVDGRRAEGGS